MYIVYKYMLSVHPNSIQSETEHGSCDPVALSPSGLSLSHAKMPALRSTRHTHLARYRRRTAPNLLKEPPTIISPFPMLVPMSPPAVRRAMRVRDTATNQGPVCYQHSTSWLLFCWRLTIIVIAMNRFKTNPIKRYMSQA